MRASKGLNSIPAEHQPSGRTKFTWLFQRLKKCKSIARHIDKIRDSSENSHRRTFNWLFDKLKAIRKDTNEEAIRKSLQLNDGKGKGKGKGDKDRVPKAAPAVQKGDVPTALPVNPKSKAQPKGVKDNPKGSKGKGKGDKPPKEDNPSVPPKSKPDGPPPKANPKENRDKATVPCLFFPKGTCNRGDSCPFSHEGPSAKAKPKAAAKGPASAKATVATLIVTGASQGANAIKTNTSCVAETLRLALIPFKFALTMFVAVSNLIIPQDQRSSNDDCLQPATSSPHTVSGVPAVVQRISESACLATANWNAGTTTIEWIADSGASRSLCSTRALQDQDLPEDVIQQSLQQEDTLKFQTGNGTTESTRSISIHGHRFGTHDHRV